MNSNLLDLIINWSEVWGLLIPLVIIIIYRRFMPEARPIIWYVILALILTTISTLIGEFYKTLPEWLKNNNVYYNIHSLIRVAFFGWYFINTSKEKSTAVFKGFLGIYFVASVINFAFFESILVLSSRLFVAESIILLFFCVLYFLRSMQSDDHDWIRKPSFLICTGISLYAATSFFIFLFFYPLVLSDWEFGYLTMSIYNMIYVVLCVLIAIALYRSRVAQKS